jgi:hypothetical protein
MIMMTGDWKMADRPKVDKLFRTEQDVVWDIADRALGGYDDFVDDVLTYPQMILEYYTGDDCPEPLNEEVYQNVMRDNPERVTAAIRLRITSRIY